MSQSLYTAMGGISAAQTQLNVVSNNIANINTVGFKESNVVFQDIFSTTMTAGNAPTVTTGGKNPVQIGLGVQVGTISKNFDSGTWSATGKNTDIMIQGNGFFTVKSSDGEVYLTKAGNFSFDANGDLVNAQGYKVMGANQVFATTGSSTNVNVPQKLVTEVQPNTDFFSKNLTDLNGAQLTAGTFTLNLKDPSGKDIGSVEITLDTKTDSSMAAITASINKQLAAASTAAGVASTAATTAAGVASTAAATAHTNAATAQGLVDTATGVETQAATDLASGTITQAQYDAIKAVQDPIIAAQGAIVTAQTTIYDNQTTIFNTQTALATSKTAEAAACTGTAAKCDATTDGTIQFTVDGTHSGSLGFVPGTSNFVLATQLASAKIDSTTNTYTSKTLDWKTNISPVVSLDNAVSVSNYTIAEDGSIEATYSNGDKLTIETNPADNTFQFKYTTSTGVIIRGNDVNVNPNVAIPSNLQVQLSNVINPEGLVAVGGNLYMPGPNTGDMIFTVGGTMGVGALKSGGLEASNVDISKQFSDMILAQRAVQANSRVFTTTSDIMQTLVQLGR